MDGWKMSFLLERPIFRGYVSFREGNQPGFNGMSTGFSSLPRCFKLTFLSPPHLEVTFSPLKGVTKLHHPKKGRTHTHTTDRVLCWGYRMLPECNYFFACFFYKFKVLKLGFWCEGDYFLSSFGRVSCWGHEPHGFARFMSPRWGKKTPWEPHGFPRFLGGLWPIFWGPKTLHFSWFLGPRASPLEEIHCL